MDVVFTFFGRFHPLLVHLPIGFILMGLLFELNKKKLNPNSSFLTFIFFWATISCLLSISSGIFQYQQEGYLWDDIKGHFFAGCFTLLLSFGFYLFLRGNVIASRIPRLFYTLGLLIVLLVTGHLGGNITHGEDYLTEPLRAIVGNRGGLDEKVLSVESYRNQAVYGGLIEPIVSNKCVRCHNPKKIKGGLQMHTLAALKEGGENGPILDFDFPELSELLIRIHLPELEKKHMPPRAQKQLTVAEIEVMNQWVSSGAPEFKTLGELEFTENQLASFMVQEKEEIYPTLNLESPDKKAIDSLRSLEVLITPIKENTKFLFVSTINYKAFSDKELALLIPLRQHIVNIDLSESTVTDTVFKVLSKFPNLVSIKLNKTVITGKGVDQLSVLTNLRKLHLINTNLNAEAIPIIANFTALEKAFVFQFNQNLATEVLLPSEAKERIDFGHYILEDLPSDSVVY
tara:strand:+ start:4203 stop:5576 length:1374 start_codon:yes stop_codon:yes gene_type:complete